MTLVLLLLAAPLDLDQYRMRLQQIDALLARGDSAAAARAARALQGFSIRAAGEELAPDDWVLGPIARREPHRARLRSLIEALAPPGTSRIAPPALALLETLRREQNPVRPVSGGEIEGIDAPGASLRERLLDWVDRTARFVGRQLLRFVRWLGGLFPTGAAPASPGGGRILSVVLIGVGAILVGVVLLALFSFGHGVPKRPGPVARERPPADADPLSRTASGWEERARELAAHGRAREAIRAWYHAVLVRCAAQGLLHHRKGRTNWEYAHALPPSLAWRGRFEDLTFRFDVEWYGRSESSGEALTAFADGAAEILRALGQRA